MIMCFQSPAFKLSENWKNNHCGPQLRQVTEVYISDINTRRSTCLDSHYAAIYIGQVSGGDNQRQYIKVYTSPRQNFQLLITLGKSMILFARWVPEHR